jgi:hypothetical protein
VIQASSPAAPTVDTSAEAVLQYLRKAHNGLRKALAMSRQDQASRTALREAEALVERALLRLTMSRSMPWPNERLRAQRRRRGWS